MTTLTVRQQRLHDLMAARARIDAQMVRLGIGLDEIAATPPPLPASIARARDLARHLVWNGSTHAEIAEQLGIHVDAVATLLAPGFRTVREGA